MLEGAPFGLICRTHSALTCLGLVLMWVRGYPVLTWGTSETRPRRLSSVSGTASTLGPMCSCTRWLVTKAQTTPILWDGGGGRNSLDVLGHLGLGPPSRLSRAPLTAARGWSAAGRS